MSDLRVSSSQGDRPDSLCSHLPGNAPPYPRRTVHPGTSAGCDAGWEDSWIYSGSDSNHARTQAETDQDIGQGSQIPRDCLREETEEGSGALPSTVFVHWTRAHAEARDEPSSRGCRVDWDLRAGVPGHLYYDEGSLSWDHNS
uniref:Uncharacterized protein n=1 Tax=Cacopsylla melanoneura TaxID=428564 RepID=A0A8D8X3U0_9HEMI